MQTNYRIPLAGVEVLAGLLKLSNLIYVLPAMPGNSDRIRLNSYSIGWGNGVIPINVLSKPFIDRTHRLATTADILIALL